MSGGRTQQQGFTLLEVLIAVLVLGIGLLAMALLQTMNVRFTKSAQQRTIATNLAYEVIDMMRIQAGDSNLYKYGAIDYSGFSSISSEDCDRTAAASIENNIKRWKCEVHSALPDGVADVSLAADGVVSVKIRWGDATWSEEDSDVNTEFTVESQI